MAEHAGRRKIAKPGRAAKVSINEKLGVNDPELQDEFRQDLEDVRAAEIQAEYDTEGIRLQ